MTPRPVQPLRVVCVDDNELVSESLRRRVESEPMLAWAGSVNDGENVAQRVRAMAPDVVLMDIDVPGVDTFAEVERLVADLPAVRVVMFSGHVNLDYLDRALDCGAWGYLSKNDDTEVLFDAIRRAGRGEIVLSKEVEAAQRNLAS